MTELRVALVPTHDLEELKYFFFFSFLDFKQNHPVWNLKTFFPLLLNELKKFKNNFLN